MRRLKRGPWLKITLISTITTVGSFVVVAALSGIIGNGMYAIVTWFLGLWSKYILANWESYLIALLLLLLSINVIFFEWHHSKILHHELEDTHQKLETSVHELEDTHQKLETSALELQTLNYALDITNHIVAMDDSLLRFLVGMTFAKDPEKEFRRLLVELLRDITLTFGGSVHRALILRPDTTGRYLKTWVHYQMPKETVARMQYYIGSKKVDKKLGVAGEAYIKKEIIVAHIRDGKCDNNNYIYFDEERPFIPYRSFVNVPIIGLIPDLAREMFNSIPCHGVICFDSDDPTIFDSKETTELLWALGRRIAVALLIYQHFLKLHHQPLPAA
jgi:hypothetical protein